MAVRLSTILLATAVIAGPVHAQDTLRAGQRIEGQLERGDPQQRSSGWFYDCYRLLGAPGSVVEVDMRSRALNTIQPRLEIAESCEGEPLDTGYRVQLRSTPLFVRAMSAGRGNIGAYILEAVGANDLQSLAASCPNPDPATRAAAMLACQALLEDGRLAPHQQAAVLVARGSHHMAAGDPVAAMADFGEAIRLHPSAPDAYIARAEVHKQRNDAQAALADYANATRVAPRDARPFMHRAVLRQNLNEPALALANANDAIMVQPELGEAWALRAWIKTLAGDTVGAIADYDEALELNPSADLALRLRATLHLELKNYDRAIADADRGAQLAPSVAEHHNQRCWARAVANRDLETARTACDLALRLQPNDANVLDSRALVGLRQGRFQEALSDWAAAVALEPTSARFRYGRGLTALRLGRAEEGRADIAAAVTLDGTVAAAFADIGLQP